MAELREVVIVSACRTPVGSFGGTLSTIPATKLGSIVVKEAVNRAKIKPEDVDEVIMGIILSGGVGQAPARQAALGAGLPNSVECLTVNKVCGSGLKSVMLAAQAIAAGDADVIVAGGMENMNLAPYALFKARTGYRMGNGELVDLMIKDGLWDVYNDFHMGMAAELCASEYKITRKEQDEFAAESYRRAIKATKEGRFKAEIVPVEVPQRKGEPIIFSEDEEPKRGKIERFPSLKPAFKPDGTVTAANASSINDGAAALVVMAEEKAKEFGITPLVRVKEQASVAKAPEWFTTAPPDAIRKVLKKANLTVDDIDLFEINEAFSVVSIITNRMLNLNPEKVNVKGGAVAIGHPIGASGARILTTLIYAMKDYNAKRGLACLCIGGGEAAALIVEKY
ncbi:acetyl-CoA C-acetyltransferase [candidate division KSB1 bacterium]|nr:MAG: acetyl-CoA C-acetyltransferase [candidate division KSB1 bacterium]